jgi:hypothetical protein
MSHYKQVPFKKELQMRLPLPYSLRNTFILFYYSTSGKFSPESMELFIENHSFSTSFGSTPVLSPLLQSAIVSLAQISCVSQVGLTVEERARVEEEPNHTTARKPSPLLTLNLPVVYMARDEMTLMGENPFREPLKGVGPENRDCFGL